MDFQLKKKKMSFLMQGVSGAPETSVRTAWYELCKEGVRRPRRRPGGIHGEPCATSSFLVASLKRERKLVK